MDLSGVQTPKRSVPFMGTRDITHKFAYFNFKVPKSQTEASEGDKFAMEELQEVRTGSGSDPGATMSSVCESIDEGYDTKEGTISSTESNTYQKQYSPVYF